jgi:hypothetical protein
MKDETRPRDRVYETIDERHYITRLGTHIHPSRRQQHRVMTRENLLLAYLATAETRERWGTIDRHAVILRATATLNRLQQRKKALARAAATKTQGSKP